MALFILCIVVLLATAAFLWCLAGFTRALKEKPKVFGLLIRVGNNGTSTTRRRKQMIFTFSDRLSFARQASDARLQKYGSLNLLILAALTMLLASPGARLNLPGLTSAIFHSNSEIQKTMFLELFKMLVQHDSSPNRNLTLNHHTDWLWSWPGEQDLGQFCRKAGFINEKIVHD
jgi:hypothetical protein